MSESKTIYCPNCGRKVGTYDGRSTNNISVKCKKCNKLIIYFAEKDTTGIRPLPERNTASGMRFY